MALVVSFRGNDADEHYVEAFAGARSLAGVSRSLALVANYASTGTVRYRFPFDNNLQFYLHAPEPASVNWRMKLLTAGGVLASGLAVNGVYDLGKLVLNRAIGNEPTGIAQEVKALDEARGGDIEALVEATEPALKEAHYGIGTTIQQIVIINGNNTAPIVQFDSSSKDYLRSDILKNTVIRDVSVAALNVNDKTGRVYILDLQKTVPFKISKEASARTLVNLSRGLSGYARKNGATVKIKYQRVEALDGRLKRIVIFDAEDLRDIDDQ